MEEKMKDLLDLFIIFARIGGFTFGGDMQCFQC